MVMEKDILESINKLCEKLKDTPYEQDAIETRQEVEGVLKDIAIQEKADAAYEEFINSGDD